MPSSGDVPNCTHRHRPFTRKTLLFGLAFVAAFVTGLAAVRTAEAAAATWNAYPGLGPPGIYEYGWHFNESAGPAYGARDYNFDGDTGATVNFVAQLTQNSVYPIRFKITH